MQSAIETGAVAMVPAELMAVLRCPRCASSLAAEQARLVCSNCRASFPCADGVVRFVQSQDYASSFGFQWQVYASTQLDDAHHHRSEEAFRRRTGLRPEELNGKRVLDVGCGMGRFAEVATRWGANLVGVDLSEAAVVAARNLADHPATMFQADVFHLPFAAGSFDVIYSIGVLHHTPDCARAFAELPRLLKPGGRIAIWVYSSYNPWYRLSDLYRRVTCRLPPRLLHKLCYGAIPLYGIHRGLRSIPVIGRPLSGSLAFLLPMSFDHDWRWRVLDTFDWYSPWYQSKHTYEEVIRWFEAAGLEDLRVGEQPIAVSGRRPLSSRGVDRTWAEAKPCAE